MIRWWPLYGLKKKWTEQKDYSSPVSAQAAHDRLFQRSLFVYVIDVGSSNALNFEISALESPQYNIHRFGIYLTDSPRHADILLILGRPASAMLEPLRETISQLPQPFGIVTIDDCPDELPLNAYPALPNHTAMLKGIPEAGDILGLLLQLSNRSYNKKEKKQKA
jgi:hypothetical protein